MTKQLFDIKTFKKAFEFKGVDSDDSLLLIMGFVKARLEHFLCKRLDYGQRSETYSGSGCNVPLQSLPIDTQEAITVIRKVKFMDAETLTTDDYEVTPWGIELATELYKGEKVTVAYKGGYKETATGSNILDFSNDASAGALVRAAMLQTMHEWQRRLKPGGTELNTDVGTLSMEPIDLLQEVKDSLESFRHPSVRWFF